MIYVLISDFNVQNNKTEYKNKRDCCVLQQPLSLLPKNVREYVENTKNDRTRIERRLAYTSLLCGLKAFYDIDKFDVKKTVDGKPYLLINDEKNQYQKNEDLHSSDLKSISPDDNGSFCQSSFATSDVNDIDEKKLTEEKTENLESNEREKLISPCPIQSENKTASQEMKIEDGMTNIQISISHSDGVSAVCISDEGEVGVDIQVEIDEERAERINKRFFSDLPIRQSEFGVEFYYCHFNEKYAWLEKIEMDEISIEKPVSRWAYFESQLKLFGGGFKDIDLLSNTKIKSETLLKKYSSQSDFAVAVSIRRW